MKRIKQKHKNGCGIACTAMVCNITYDKALKLIFTKKPKKITGTKLRDDQRALFKLNKVSCVRLSKRIKIAKLKNNAIISYRIAPKHHHAVVWDAENKKIICPSGNKNTPHRLDFIQKNLNGILEVKS